MKNKLLTTYFIITIGIFLMGAASWKTELVDVLQDLRDSLSGNPEIGNKKYEFHVGTSSVYKFDPVTGDTWVRKDSSATNDPSFPDVYNYSWSYIPSNK